MTEPIDTIPQNHPILTEAARKALRYHPEFVTGGHTLDLVAEALSSFLSTGDPGTVVWAWGRPLAADILAGIKSMDDDERVVKLREAVNECVSLRDEEGTRDSVEFHTAARASRQPAIDQYAAENPSSTPATPIPAPVPARVVSSEEMRLRELLLNVYMQHGDTLPEGVFGQEYEGWEHRYSQTVQFDEVAEMLAQGSTGSMPYLVGREYSQHILAALERAEFFELCAALRLAIEYATCPFDALGHLGPDTPGINAWD